jgi:hypothetical protein
LFDLSIATKSGFDEASEDKWMAPPALAPMQL